jgi:hypothetical protein
MRPLLPEAGGTIAAVERLGGASTSEAGADVDQCRRLGELDFASSLRTSMK